MKFILDIKMKVFICFYLIPMILSLPFKDSMFVCLFFLNKLGYIYLDEDCWINHNKTITNKYAVLVNFASNSYSDEDCCSVQIVNPWSEEMQNGFGVFLRQAIDCSSTVTIECLPGSIFLKQVMILSSFFSLLKYRFYIDHSIGSAIYMSYEFE
jgi:hypothetical protein